jgi:3',5'-cyclic AMP phosphodiesterase CpdA
MNRIALISDTHLSPHHGFFHANVARTIEAVNEALPDLVVNCGDLTINGADEEDDLRFAAFVHRAVAAPLALIPGNHDVGEEPGALHVDQPISDDRLARYRRVFGEDRWARDLGAWRLIGLNGLLIGTDLVEERLQLEWLTEELDAAHGRPIGVFTHKPLWLETIDEAPVPEWTVAPARRAAFAAQLQRAQVSFIASGHVHQSRARLSEGALHIWTPSCAFPAGQSLGGDTSLGYALLNLRDDGAVAARFVTPDGLAPRTLDEIKGHGTYAFLKDCPPCIPDVDWC